MMARQTKIGCAVFVILTLLIVAVMPAIHSAREAAKLMQCGGCKQISLAFHNYHEKYGAFPPAYTVDHEGKPLHSWRVLLLEVWDDLSPGLYGKIRLDEPWDSDYNKQFHNQRPRVFACPCDFGEGGHREDTTHTNFLRIVGPDAMTNGPDTVSIEEIAYPDETILFVESTRPVCWMKPEDISTVYDALNIQSPPRDSKAGISSRHQSGFVWIGYANGDITIVPERTPKNLIKAAARCVKR